MDNAEGSKSHLRDLVRMAAVDDSIALEELSVLFKIAKRHGMSAEELQQFILASESTESTSTPPDILVAVDRLYDLAVMAHADGKVEAAERQMIGVIAVRLGIPREGSLDFTDGLLQDVAAGMSKDAVLGALSEVLNDMPRDGGQA